MRLAPVAGWQACETIDHAEAIGDLMEMLAG